MVFKNSGIFSSDSPLIISGPCSAETEDQLLTTANLLKKTGKVHVLRAGIWKPRTRPNSFEGVGEPGLKWLKQASIETGLPVTTEVANAKHVEQCLKMGIDILWIGARTTVNPFAVQEIADALKGVDIPVMVKNPINPDLGLWMGAIERIYNSGITEIAAIHRGFSSANKNKYRNKPMWEIPIALKSEFSTLPIICDPSHIGGNRSLIAPISQRAFDLGFNGLMIESHLAPDDAWSDASQQITPQILGDIINDLQVKSTGVEDPKFNHQLEILRADIDELDEEILSILGKRMSLVKEIGYNKKEHNILPLQLVRWNEILQSRTSIGKKLNLSESFIIDLFNAIHNESLEKQTKIVEQQNKNSSSDGLIW